MPIADILFIENIFGKLLINENRQEIIHRIFLIFLYFRKIERPTKTGFFPFSFKFIHLYLIYSERRNPNGYNAKIPMSIAIQVQKLYPLAKLT